MKEQYNGANHELSPKNLDELIDDVATNEILVASDGHVPEHVKRKVNDDLWGRLQNEDHPED